MLADVLTAALQGIDGLTVHLETDFTRQGLPAYTMVGLAEGAVRESKERVFTALKNSGYKLPPARITINLAPADLRKEGSSYDLPLALCLLAAAEVLPQDILKGWFLAGELSLNGELKPVTGMLPLAVQARDQGARGIMVPEANAAEAAVVKGLEVYGVDTLSRAVKFLLGEEPLEPASVDMDRLWAGDGYHAVDFSEVKGQEHAKRAIEIAAAGSHNLLFIGPPGSGKTMLAQRIPTVLPPLEFEEALEVTKVYSVAGQLNAKQALVTTRPFRSPHHTISDAGLIGGGAYPKPGEISLAHRGVLFLDELPEFKKNVLEVMRQPLEDGRVTISRAAISLSYPAEIMLVAAMNPCPCGYSGDDRHVCHCTPQAVNRYRSRLSGPLLDRIDLQVEVPAVDYKDLERPAEGEGSAAMRSRIAAARELQHSRYRDTGIHANSELNGSLLEKHCALKAPEREFLGQAARSLGLSARAYTRVIRIARTIADLEHEQDISTPHLAEAVNYRTMDRDQV